MTGYFFLAVFKVLSLSFDGLIIISIWVLWVYQLGVCWASWICRFVSFIWEVFSRCFFKYSFGPFLSTLGFPDVYIHCWCPLRPLALFTLLHSSFHSSDVIISSSWFLFLLPQICCWSVCWIFHFSYCTFSFIPSFNFSLYSCLAHTSFSCFL